MAKRLIRAGHKVSMICGTSDTIDTTSKPGTLVRSRHEGIDVYRFIEPYSNSMSFFRRWIAFLRFTKEALKIAGTIDEVDIVFATSTPLTAGDIGRKSAKIHKCPFVFEVRDLWPELPIAMGIVRHWPLKWYLKRMELRAYRAADRCIALAPGIKEGIAETGFPEDKIEVVPNSCDVDLFIPSESNVDVDHDP
ncbi:MAG: glycosyltransferase, partial [Planctomycetaceae bacterium]|nr:glycosyltransferase [Planctomycetaceae bacterium]